MDLTSILEKYDVAGADASDFPAVFENISTAAGNAVFREGEPAHAFFFISSGRDLVAKTAPSGEEDPLAVLGEGDFFGEVGLLFGRHRGRPLGDKSGRPAPAARGPYRFK